ncbi:hypothetical protein TSUD_412110 [Trifolium subterraneum]|uniref:CCHC-type domain-containing protein n=1 Tax=Trifolium subterraneum TaxID=3900 RepID=A0A2Z6PKG1_TRISU|nr:hypothetical protein TSUD_412110 [Trifolium subterraneum]
MAKNAKFISEGGSSNRPPLFDGDNYYYWNDKMEHFLRSQDNNMWHVVEVSKYVPLAKDSTNPKPQAEWTTQEADKISITVAKDLTKVSLEDLIGSLKAHESILQEDKPKKKMIALETQSGECSQKDETFCENEESLQEEDEEELAYLSRRIQRLMTRRNQLKKNFQPKRNGAKPEVDMRKIQCYGCSQYGHYKNDCPKNKQKKPFFKKKSMMATWDDLEEAQSEDEEQEANVCLMTHSNTEEECLLAVKRRPWYLDSGCSRHMTGDRNNFLSFETREGGSITFGNNEKASIKAIGNIEDCVRTRKALQDVENNLGLISQIEPKSINEAIIDESWVEAMKEELQQFEKNEVWNLVPSPKDHSIIGTRWVFRNKLDENGKVVRNKARLVAQGYNQQEGIDYDETFAPAASEFEMSMMGELGFFLGLQIKQQEDGIFICQEKYVNDLLKKYKMNEAKIMSTPMHPSTSLDKDEKGKDVSEKEYRGIIGSLLYLTASRHDIVFAVGLCARFQTSPKESHLIAVKRSFRYLVGTPDVGLWYKKGSHFDLQAYCDADNAGDKIERKSTSGGCQFLGEALVSWCCRKQNTIALSTTEAEYVAASNCCSQVLWIKNQLEDFSLSFLFIISQNPLIFHQPKSNSDLLKWHEPKMLVEERFLEPKTLMFHHHHHILHHRPPKPLTPKSSSSSSFETVSETLKSFSERGASPEIQSTPITTNMQTNDENPPNSPNTVFNPSQSESPENSPIHLTQNQPESSSPIESPSTSQNPINNEDSPSPIATVPSPKDTPPALKPVVDTTVHVLDPSDSKTTLLEKEIDDFELEPVTSTKYDPVKAKKTPTPKKKVVETAVKAPRTKKKVTLKKSKEQLLPAPLILPEDEEVFDQYWKTKPIAPSRMYNFGELSQGGVDLVKYVEPFGWKSFFHIKETIFPLLVQAFYYNAVYPDRDLLTSNIKDVELVVDPFVIGDLIGIKSEGLEVCGNDWYDQVKVNKEDLKREMFTEEGAKKNAPPSSMLKKEFKLLHNMCQHSFFPRTGSNDKVTDIDLLLMYHMAKGIKLNLPYIILHHIIHAATSGFKKIVLPYGMILTRVFRFYYANMNDTPYDNHYYTFNLKNKTNLNILADASGDRLENALQTDGNVQISGDAIPTTESEKLVTTAATTLQGFKHVTAQPGTTMFSPLMTSSQGSLSSFCTSEFIRNILTSNTPENSTLPIPNPTESTLPSIPSSFATFDSFCSSVNAANSGTKQLVFEGNFNFDFPGPSRPAKCSKLETDMEQMRKDLDHVIKGMAVQYSMIDHLILESKSLREWFANIVCPQLHINPPPEIETPQFDPFPAPNNNYDNDDCPPTSLAPDGANE